MGSPYQSPSAPERTKQNSNFCFFRHRLLVTKISLDCQPGPPCPLYPFPYSLTLCSKNLGAQGGRDAVLKRNYLKMNYFNAPKILWRKLLQQVLESSCSGQISNYGWKGSAKILNQGHNQYWSKETLEGRNQQNSARFLLLLIKFVFKDDLHHDHCFFHCNAL